MQVSYKGFIFILNFEMADEILNPGSPNGKRLIAQLLLFTKKKNKKLEKKKTALKYK